MIDAAPELRLGRYALKRPLGEGGSGQVFLAWQDNATGEPLVCVVKFPLQRLATKPEGRDRFLHEAKLAMRLGTHPNIVQVIDVGIHRTMPFIVMEYVDGTDLAQLLRHLRRGSRGLPLAAAYNVLASAASALHHAHAGATVAREPVGVIHRDIKPGNILVTRDGVTKLGDFGIGRAVDEETSGEHMRGTYRYMSPEHISGDACPEMDVYALGVVAWEMLENRVYRAGVEGMAHFAAIMSGRTPAFESPSTPRQLVAIIEACLDPNPSSRPSARELLRALEKCPGYTRDPADLQVEIASILGPHRSSGKTLHDLTLTPELAATFAALDAVPSSSRPAAAASRKRDASPASSASGRLERADPDAHAGDGSIESQTTQRRESRPRLRAGLLPEASTPGHTEVSPPPRGAVVISDALSAARSEDGARPRPLTDASPAGPAGDREFSYTELGLIPPSDPDGPPVQRARPRDAAAPRPPDAPKHDDPAIAADDGEAPDPRLPSQYEDDAPRVFRRRRGSSSPPHDPLPAAPPSAAMPTDEEHAVTTTERLTRWDAAQAAEGGTMPQPSAGGGAPAAAGEFSVPRGHARGATEPMCSSSPDGTAVRPDDPARTGAGTDAQLGPGSDANHPRVHAGDSPKDRGAAMLGVVIALAFGALCIAAGVRWIHGRASADEPWYDAGRRSFVLDRPTHAAHAFLGRAPGRDAGGGVRGPSGRVHR